MKIGILQAGHSPDEAKDAHGDYDQFFVNFLANRGFEFETFAVVNGVFPNSVADAEGWLITGSRFGAYEPHDWIPPLESFLRDVYGAGVPIVGVCFGHQILAQALGGKVEKYKDGWSAGPQKYTSEKFGAQNIIAWHQDQVVERPAEATVAGSSAFCENAILVYGDKALTIQPHPEFTSEFMMDLLKARRKNLPASICDDVENRANEPLTSSAFATHIEQFFKANRTHRGGA